VLASLLAALGGCAGQPAGGEQSAMTPREETCTRLLRDMRLYCNEGIREDDRASFRMECMSRRLAFDRQCF